MDENITENISPELSEKISSNDLSVVDDPQIKNLQNEIDVKNNPDAIKDYHDQLKNPQPIQNKMVLDNGESKVPEFELLDLLTLGITYLIKLAKQGRKDCEQFRSDEPRIANNCQQNGIDYVRNNRKDNIKDVSQGIGLFHDINDLKKKIENGEQNPDLQKQLEEKQSELSKMCNQNETLNTLINSDNPSCAVANGMFHGAIIASKINENGEKEFYLIDQGGRKVPGSGFPSDEELSKNGINITQVASTNPMCMATANAGLQEISTGGLDAYLDKYTGLVQSSQRENVNHEASMTSSISNELNENKENTLQISGIQDGNEQSAKKVDSADISTSKPLQISFGENIKTEQNKNNTQAIAISNINETSSNDIKKNVNAGNTKAKNNEVGIS